MTAADLEKAAQWERRKQEQELEQKPRVVLYEPVAPNASEELSWHAKSPVNEVRFDRLERLEDARFAHRTAKNGYDREVALPLDALGFKPEPGMRVRFDFGVLSTDRSGNAVGRGLNWADRATALLADVPSEARLPPHLWGHLHGGGERSGPGRTPDAEELEPKAAEQDQDMQQFLEEMDKQG